jgi:hypothetical protein
MSQAQNMAAAARRLGVAYLRDSAADAVIDGQVALNTMAHTYEAKHYAKCHWGLPDGSVVLATSRILVCAAGYPDEPHATRRKYLAKLRCFACK